LASFDALVRREQQGSDVQPILVEAYVDGSCTWLDSRSATSKAGVGWKLVLSNSELAHGPSPSLATDVGSYAAELDAATVVVQKVLSLLAQFYAIRDALHEH